MALMDLVELFGRKNVQSEEVVARANALAAALRAEYEGDVEELERLKSCALTAVVQGGVKVTMLFADERARGFVHGLLLGHPLIRGVQ